MVVRGKSNVSVMIIRNKASVKPCVQQIEIFRSEIVIPDLIQQVNKYTVFLPEYFFQFDHDGNIFTQYETIEKENRSIIISQELPFVVLHHGLKLVEIAD